MAHNLTDSPLAADKDSEILKEIDTLKSEIKALTLAQIELTTLVKDHLTNRTTQADKKDTDDERTQNVSASVEHEDKERKETNVPKDETKDEQKIGPKDDQNEDENRGLKRKVDTMTKATTAKDLTQGIKVVENIEDDNDESFEIPCAQPQNHNHSWMRGNQSFFTSPCSDHLFSHAVASQPARRRLGCIPAQNIGTSLTTSLSEEKTDRISVSQKLCVVRSAGQITVSYCPNSTYTSNP